MSVQNNSLRTENLSIEIAEKQVCQQFNLTLNGGEIWAVLGRNGVGKTTLLHTLAGLRAPQSGEIFLQQDNIKQLSRKQIAQKIGLLLQHHDDSFPSSVLETALIGRHPFIDAWQWESPDDVQLAMQALEVVGLDKMCQRQINNLSGGERQRLSIASLLTQNPGILLLDEPNSHLDLNYQINCLNHLCQTAKKDNQVLMMSLHDINLAVRYCDHILLLSGDGEIQAGHADDMLNEELLSQTFAHPVCIRHVDNKKIILPE